MSVALRRHATRRVIASGTVSEGRVPAHADTKLRSATLELGPIVDLGPDRDVAAELRLRIPLDTPESRQGLGSVLRLEPGLLQGLPLFQSDREAAAASPRRSALCGSGRSADERVAARRQGCLPSGRQRTIVKWRP